MARRRRGPTLLELIREPPPGGSFNMSTGGGGGRHDIDPAPRAAGPGRLSSWWQVGTRTVRLPIGYLFVALAVVLLLTLAGYWVGYTRARDEASRELARRTSAMLGGIEDPLNTPATASPPPQTRDAGAPSQPQTRQTQSNPPQTQTASNQPGAGRQGGQAAAQRGAGDPASPPRGVTFEDPRREGLNYFIIARLGPDEAVRAASFLAEGGVPTAVVPTNSDRFRHVISVQGFEGGAIFGPEGNRLKQRILELGQIYRTQHRGPTDFSDTYGLKHSRGG